MATTLLSLCNQCDCKSRQAKLNQLSPGLGDKVATVFNPIQRILCTESGKQMGDILKPDMKSLVWLAVGFLVIPRVLSMVKK